MRRLMFASASVLALMIATGAHAAEDNTPNWMKSDAQKAQDAANPPNQWGGYGGGQPGQQQQGGEQGGGWQGGNQGGNRPPQQQQSQGGWTPNQGGGTDGQTHRPPVDHRPPVQTNNGWDSQGRPYPPGEVGPHHGPVYGTPGGGYQGGDVHVHVHGPDYSDWPRRPPRPYPGGDRWRDSDGDGIPDYRDNYDNRRRHGGSDYGAGYQDRDHDGIPDWRDHYDNRQDYGRRIDPYYNRNYGQRGGGRDYD